MKVYELLDIREKWTTGFNARDIDGYSVDATSSRAICWCLQGAFERCYPSVIHRNLARRKFLSIVGSDSVWLWNDSPDRTFGEVKAVLFEADV